MTTNYKRIKNMTIEELTEFFFKLLDNSEECEGCPDYKMVSKQGINQWLQAESEE